MTAVKESRKTVRLHVEHGLVLLRAPRRTALPCSLSDLSASGCRARIQLENVDSTTLTDWTPLLATGARLGLELSLPPLFQALKLQAAVAHVQRDAMNNPELGLAFVDLAPAQTEALHRALQAITADKIKRGIHVEESAPLLALTGDCVQLPVPVEHTEWLHEKLSQKSVGEVLIMLELLTAENSHEYSEAAIKEHTSLAQYLLKHCLISANDLCRAQALNSGLPMVNLREKKIADEFARVFSYLTMLRHSFVPFAYSKEILCIASVEPLTPETMTELCRHCGKEILNFLAPTDQIRALLFRMRPRASFKERRHPRFEASIPVSFLYCDENGINLDDESYSGEIRNLSEGGFLVQTTPISKFSARYLIEHRIQMRLSFAWPPDNIQALCLIRNIQSPRQDILGEPVWLMALQNVDLSERDSKLLRDVCAKASIS